MKSLPMQEAKSKTVACFGSLGFSSLLCFFLSFTFLGRLFSLCIFLSVFVLLGSFLFSRFYFCLFLLLLLLVLLLLVFLGLFAFRSLPCCVCSHHSLFPFHLCSTSSLLVSCATVAEKLRRWTVVECCN
ncbi:hypothetical protein NC651_017371 [Populus alba x Populus x berolinensis]|nr:hypothetical protein NC651_017371 [Populus alba x Populus x berolinensis]